MSMRRILVATLLYSSGALLRADFTYQESTQMTGGAVMAMMRMAGPFAKGAREPIVSTHIIHGDRMATITKDRINIVDLGKEAITEIDLAKKTYSVMTFAEMKQAMEDAMKRMQGKNGDGNIDGNFKVSAKATGET